MSNTMLDKSLDKSFNSSFGTSESEEVIITNDGGDSLSDDSDDTSYSTWKGPPPPDKRIHRYLDEMRVSTMNQGWEFIKQCIPSKLFMEHIRYSPK